MNSEKLIRQVKKEMKTLSPVGASERQMHAVYTNYEHAMQNMRNMQVRFNQERETIRSTLSQTQKSPALNKSSKSPMRDLSPKVPQNRAAKPKSKSKRSRYEKLVSRKKRIENLKEDYLPCLLYTSDAADE